MVLAAMLRAEQLTDSDSSSDGGSSGVGNSPRGRFPRTVGRRIEAG